MPGTEDEAREAGSQEEAQKEEAPSGVDVLSEYEIKPFTIETVSRFVRAEKCVILVLSDNKKMSDMRAKNLYSTMPRQVVYPHYHKIKLRNGSEIIFIVDHDQARGLKPTYVFE